MVDGIGDKMINRTLCAGRIIEVLPGIYRIPVPLAGNPLKELNSYVIKGNREGGGAKNLLIDTGFRTEECRTTILDGLKELGIHMEETDILLTHLHADHSGNAADLICDGNRVYMGETDIKCLLGSRLEGSGRKPHSAQWEVTDSHSFGTLHRLRMERYRQNGISNAMLEEMSRSTPSRTMAADPMFSDYTPLKEGDRIHVGDYQLNTISVPGHTPGQLCFEIEGTGAMILGDHVLFDITPNITDWAGVEDSLGDYLDSLKKIDKYDVMIPLPGHRAAGDFHGRIKAISEHHQRRLDECRQIIRELGREKGKARLYDITGRMKWKIRADGWDNFPPAQRWFALGECLAHIDYLKRQGQIGEHWDGGSVWYEA